MNVRSFAAAAALASVAACTAPQAETRGLAMPPPAAMASPVPAAPPPPPEPPGLEDAGLGLARGSVFEVVAPPRVAPERSEPGEKPVVPRAFPGAPPVAPHELVDYTPITRDSNACLDCHQIPGPREVGQPTPLPASHYLDLRRAPEKPRKEVAGARFVCTACHVSRTDQVPLVKNPGW